MFAVGGFITPLVVSPFLDETTTEKLPKSCSTNFTDETIARLGTTLAIKNFYYDIQTFQTCLIKSPNYFCIKKSDARQFRRSYLDPLFSIWLSYSVVWLSIFTALQAKCNGKTF